VAAPKPVSLGLVSVDEQAMRGILLGMVDALESLKRGKR
jgi:hypothetical protein